MSSQIIPSFFYEQQYWSNDIKLIAGIDEVGMGALAGPVVAAAVIFQEPVDISGLRDSKKMTAKKRVEVMNIICEHALSYGIGEANIAEISQLNIRQASHLAMQRAIKALSVKPDMLLIDGNPAQPHPTIPAVNIIRGDSYSSSIAAASVIAKVYRDNIMTKIDHLYPNYGFAQNKGYGSAKHLAALSKYGVSKHHRPTYGPISTIIAKNLLVS